MPSLKQEMKEMTFLEKKREKERHISEVMQSSDKEDINSQQANKETPKQFLKLAQFASMFVYGIITVTALFALICYLADMAASAFDGGFGEYMNYMLLTVVIFTIVGSILGCCLTFKYGTVSTNIDRLQNQAVLLHDKVEKFTQVQELLSDEVEELKSTLYGISVEKNQLLRCVDRFDVLSANMHANGIMHDAFVSECDHMCDDLWKQYEAIKIQTEKADLLKLFYDKQTLDDNDHGLNKNEFEFLLFDLNDEIKDRFPRFEEFDENHDGVIEIFEFENVLDRIYEQILEERVTRATHRRGNNDNQIEREERRAKIDKEKRKEKSYFKSDMFKMLK